MPPGSARALVLPNAATLGIDPTAGPLLSRSLEEFLDPTSFSAVAVVHGLGKWAGPAFDRAKRRANDSQGVVWVTNDDLLPHLSGAQADVLRRLLASEPGSQVTFFSVRDRARTGRLRWSELRDDQLDRAFNRADQGSQPV